MNQKHIEMLELASTVMAIKNFTQQHLDSDDTFTDDDKRETMYADMAALVEQVNNAVKQVEPNIARLMLASCHHVARTCSRLAEMLASHQELTEGGLLVSRLLAQQTVTYLLLGVYQATVAMMTGQQGGQVKIPQA